MKSFPNFDCQNFISVDSLPGATPTRRWCHGVAANSQEVHRGAEMERGNAVLARDVPFNKNSFWGQRFHLKIQK